MSYESSMYSTCVEVLYQPGFHLQTPPAHLAMPATKTKPSASKARKPPAPKRPSKPFPGYLTDEWYQYTMACMERVTPAEVRRDLVKFEVWYHRQEGQLHGSVSERVR